MATKQWTSERRRRGILLSGAERIPADHLVTMCWCEREMVAVPRRDVLAGTTRSCGHPDCHAPKVIT
jgi:hypothetical protein